MTTVAAPAAGLTPYEIACAIPLPYYAKRSGVAFVEALLESERRRGHAREDEDGRWSLTESAELRYGAALRDLAAP